MASAEAKSLSAFRIQLRSEAFFSKKNARTKECGSVMGIGRNNNLILFSPPQLYWKQKFKQVTTFLPVLV